MTNDDLIDGFQVYKQLVTLSRDCLISTVHSVESALNTADSHPITIRRVPLTIIRASLRRTLADLQDYLGDLNVPRTPRP